MIYLGGDNAGAFAGNKNKLQTMLALAFIKNPKAFEIIATAVKSHLAHIELRKMYQAGNITAEEAIEAIIKKML